jgi:hypothetical protein
MGCIFRSNTGEKGGEWRKPWIWQNRFKILQKLTIRIKLAAANIEVDRQVGRLINRMMLSHGSASHIVSEALGVASQYNFTKLVEQGEAQRMYRRREYEKKWKRTGLHFGRNGMDLGGKTCLVRGQAQAALMNFERHRNPRIEGKASAKPAGIFV